jgi:RNA polymerase sigma factor (sigma-70 family)
VQAISSAGNQPEMDQVAVPARVARPIGPRLPARLLRLVGDERLVEHVRAGSVAAFEVVYDRHHRGMLAFCRHMLGSADEAEDAVQHTFMAAHNGLLASSRPIQLRPWLYAIARNRCLSMLRARRETPSTGAWEPATEHLAAEVQRREDLRDVLRDVASLPDDQRAALVLAELGDVGHDEIAQVLDCPREKVKALVFQARTSLNASRAARETSCAEIREQVANLRGGSLRRNSVRRHLRECAGCREFRAAVREQRRALAIILPVAPSLGLKEAVLGSAVGGGGAAAAAGGGGGAVAAKALVAVAVAGSGATATVEVTRHPDPEPVVRPAPAAPSVGPARSAGGAPAVTLTGPATAHDRRPGLTGRAYGNAAGADASTAPRKGTPTARHPGSAAVGNGLKPHVPAPAAAGPHGPQAPGNGNSAAPQAGAPVTPAPASGEKAAPKSKSQGPANEGPEQGQARGHDQPAPPDQSRPSTPPGQGEKVGASDPASEGSGRERAPRETRPRVDADTPAGGTLNPPKPDRPATDELRKPDRPATDELRKPDRPATDELRKPDEPTTEKPSKAERAE